MFLNNNINSNAYMTNDLKLIYYYQRNVLFIYLLSKMKFYYCDM